MRLETLLRFTSNCPWPFGLVCANCSPPLLVIRQNKRANGVQLSTLSPSLVSKSSAARGTRLRFCRHRTIRRRTQHQRMRT
jgi:hypothetical protein